MKIIKLYIAAFLLFVFISSAAAQTIVTIDVKPTSINPQKKGLITVAIITDSDFNATTVDPLTVLFGPANATEKHGKGHIEDANGDGDEDLVLHFSAKDTGIQCGDTSASLTGKTFDNESIEGNDDITTVGSCWGKSLRKGPMPPKEICLNVPGSEMVFAFVTQAGNCIKCADNKKLNVYAIQGIFKNDSLGIVSSVDGSGFIDSPLFHFLLNGAYYDSSDETIISQAMEGVLDLSEEPASGSVSILVSDVDGNSQVTYSLLEVSCSEIALP